MRLTLALTALLFLASCIVHRLDVVPLPLENTEPIRVETPVKAHLRNGSTIVYADGMEVRNGVIYGSGMRYDLGLASATAVSEVPMDDVAAMESYQTPVSKSATTAATAASGTGILIGSLLAAVALFGSCPTVYALNNNAQLPDAELFSYSIAPSFQSRDVDTLGLAMATDGVVSLSIRNEMLETHYIDQVQLLEVSHSPTATVVADQYGRAIIANELAAPVSATDQSGRNLLSAVARNDGAASKATQQRLNSIAADNLRDHIDLEFDVEPGTDDVALYLRLRNSLLNTVLFYDVMLAEQGFGALDWLGRDVNQLLNTLNVGLWYRANMGLEILVWDGEAYQSAGHLADQGPIAWSERAILLPAVGDSKTLRVRLSYVADNWRIDQVALASGAQLVESRQVNVARANAEDGALPDVPAFLAAADEQYLITRPGESISVYFDVGQADAGMARTYLLASSGYYIEWMRPEWLRAEAAAAFVANDDALLRAIRLYAERRDGYRELFETNRVMMQ